VTNIFDLGLSVFCDFCDGDFTSSDATGGLLFESKAVCPDCTPGLEANAKSYGEEKYIRARCPEGVSFAGWVRGMRFTSPGGNTVQVSDVPDLKAFLDGLFGDGDG
jgi:hypothetical protein